MTKTFEITDISWVTGKRSEEFYFPELSTDFLNLPIRKIEEVRNSEGLKKQYPGVHLWTTWISESPEVLVSKISWRVSPFYDAFVFQLKDIVWWVSLSAAFPKARRIEIIRDKISAFGCNSNYVVLDIQNASGNIRKTYFSPPKSNFAERGKEVVSSSGSDWNIPYSDTIHISGRTRLGGTVFIRSDTVTVHDRKGTRHKKLKVNPGSFLSLKEASFRSCRVIFAMEDWRGRVWALVASEDPKSKVQCITLAYNYKNATTLDLCWVDL